jgi:membrane protein DedA with SNARE-associated domain
VALALLLVGVLVSGVVDGADRFRLVAEGTPTWAYVTVFLLVFADGVCALFPAETTLNTASALVVEGVLDLAPVMVAGALGAVGGDSALYWLARLSRRRFQAQLDRAVKNHQVAMAMDLIGSSAPLLLCVGRYVPGLRFVVNATCGLTPYPYRRFLLWSAVGGTTWSVVTCCIAYLVATALAGYPLAAVVVSGGISTVAIACIFVFVRRRRRAAASRAVAG